jgi:CheY-like chemotaxis protein
VCSSDLSPLGEPWRVLVVDDEPMCRTVAQELLGGFGIAVDTAAGGAQAVTMAAARRYDLILMDMQMPQVDGLEATRRIRALAQSDGVPIVALTANAFNEDRVRCLEGGMDGFIAKPLDLASLDATLRRWLLDRHTRGVPAEAG